MLVGSIVLLLSSCSGSPGPPDPTPPPAIDRAAATAVDEVVTALMATEHLKAVIAEVSVDGRVITRRAYGESMRGVPATTEMHFRNGAVAVSYISTLLLRLVDDGMVDLDDRVSTWLPDVRYADQVTLRQLAQMTAGYEDYVSAPAFTKMLYADPFRTFTPEELIAIGTSRPLLYPPGTNWNYSHTDYVILGLALEKITGLSLREALSEYVLGPLGLDQTLDPGTPYVPAPALQVYTSERRWALGIPSGTPFYEDSTYWNPSWTLARGAIQTTTIDDLHTTAIAVGTGSLLTGQSYSDMITKSLIGQTTYLEGCATCYPQQSAYTYGLGIVSTGDWLMQNSLSAGQGSAFAYLPSRKVAIAVTVTFTPQAFTEPESPDNAADLLWRRIAAELVPDEAPVIRSGPR
ncbi:MAG TPA: serine hydrolase domain-containing protein [Microlunatus sp.]|nr:serine hydrolase domain-containing protein [Microlunatus sp.]